TPFRATYWALYTEEGEHLPFSSQVQYLLLPSHLTGEDATVFSEISPFFTPIRVTDTATAYKRIAEPTPTPAPSGP
ncbi:MAG: hypothetical protein ACRDYC_12665, partial [Acidimicrobiales bacterium]